MPLHNYPIRCPVCLSEVLNDTEADVHFSVCQFRLLPFLYIPNSSNPVVSAAIDGSHNLILTRLDATTVNLGSVQGPTGATGSSGATGSQGSTGATGSQGTKGDTGNTGSTGSQGADGTNGNTILNGSGTPSSGTGNNSDFYIDTSASLLYGPKTSGVWGSGVSIVGSTGNTGATGSQGIQGATGNTGATGSSGTNGNTLLNGSGIPSGGTGNNGDFYLDTTANKIYGPKTSGAWGSGTSIIGPTGSTGAAGSTGSTGPTGATGGYAGVSYYTSYGAGTAYNLTASSAAVTMGTTSPSITISVAGTYLLLGRGSLVYNLATYLATQTATIKLRRTNNTAVDLANASTVKQLRALTLITDSAGSFEIPPTIYTTSNTNDVITLFAGVSAAPTAGNVQIQECDIQAIRIS